MSKVKDIEAVAYKPSEIIGTVKAWLMKQNETAKMVLVEGVYKPKTDIARYAYCYDFKIIFCNYFFGFHYRSLSIYEWELVSK